MLGVPLGGATVFGSNFTSDAQVLIDGVQAQQTIFQSSTELDVSLAIAIDFTAAVHRVTVQQGSGNSNNVSFTVYSPVQGPQPFNAIPGFDPGGSNSGLMTVADVNGDGFADVIMPGPPINNGSTLAVMFGQASGQLSAPVITPGLITGAMAAGDVNGDGSVDIVCAAFDASGSPVVSILLNDGKGNFRQSSTISFAGGEPGIIALVDVDGDGKPDILFTDAISGSLFYLQNLGGGSFAAPVALTTPTGGVENFAVGDFNENGHPDIVYVAANMNTGQDEFHMLVNQGGGAFSDQLIAGIPVEAGYFAVGDFNHDGHLDIAVEPYHPFVSLPSVAVSVFFGDGHGNFAAGPTTTFETNPFQTFQLVAGDFDGDGNLDLAGVNGDTEPGHVAFLWGDGAGHFTPQQVNGPMGFSLTTGDVNGDGVTDVLIPDRFGIISVALGQKTRAIPSNESFTPNYAGIVSAGDVNGDKKLDLFLPSYDGTLASSLYLNQGGEQFTREGNPSGLGVIIADLDGDGLAEMIGTDGTNILIWKGSGDPNFGSPPTSIAPPPNVGFQPFQMQIVDMDGDGRPDIVMPNVILYNEGNLTFTAVPVNFGATNSPFVVGDFNHDGRMDIVTGGFTLLGQPNRTFTTVTPNNLNITNGNYAVVGDLNQDGYLDVVYGGDEEPVVIYYGKGDGTFYEQSQLNVGPVSDFSQSLAIADFNGDGRPDILACLFLSQQCVVYTNDGTGGFQRSYFASGATSVAALALDLTGDGNADVVVTNYNLDFRPSNFDIIPHK